MIWIVGLLLYLAIAWKIWERTDLFNYVSKIGEPYKSHPLLRLGLVGIFCITPLIAIYAFFYGLRRRYEK